MDILIYFASEYNCGSLNELDALLEEEGLNPRDVYPRPDETDWRVQPNLLVDPFLVIKLPSLDVANNVVRRAVMIKCAWHLWSQAATLHGVLHAAVHEVRADVSGSAAAVALRDPTKTWRLWIDTYGAHISPAAQAAVREHFGVVLSPAGRVKLGDGADVTLCCMLDFGGDHLIHKSSNTAAATSAALAAAAAAAPPAELDVDAYPCCGLDHLISPACCTSTVCATAGSTSSDGSPVPPVARLGPLRRVYYGVELAASSRPFLSTLSLKTRAYLGPTSLDAQLALLMSSIGGCCAGRTMYDPFVGTGSLTVAAAKLGAFTAGSDIDMRVLRGKLGRNIATNFAQYGIGIPEVWRLDTAAQAVRQVPLWDAIVTDPPYGVRAGARKSGRQDGKQGADIAIPTELRDSHIPATQVYNADDVMLDLLDTAARLLTTGGKLVYLLPATVDIQPAELPVHPCLKLVSVSQEQLSPVLLRLIVCMRKVCDYDHAQAGEYRAASIAAAEACGMRGAGVRERMSKLLDGWVAANEDKMQRVAKLLETNRPRALAAAEAKKKRKQAQAQAGASTSASAAADDVGSDSGSDSDSGDDDDGSAGGAGGGAGAESLADIAAATALGPEAAHMSVRQRKLELRRLKRQVFRIQRMEARERAKESGAATATAAEGGAAQEGAAEDGAGAKTGVRAARRAAREARVQAALLAQAEGRKFHIAHMPFDPAPDAKK